MTATNEELEYEAQIKALEIKHDTLAEELFEAENELGVLKEEKDQLIEALSVLGTYMGIPKTYKCGWCEKRFTEDQMGSICSWGELKDACRACYPSVPKFGNTDGETDSDTEECSDHKECGIHVIHPSSPYSDDVTGPR